MNIIGALFVGAVFSSVAASAVSAQELTQRDIDAANAIIMEKVKLQTYVQQCKKYVPEEANGQNIHDKFDLVWKDWQEVNFDFLDVASIIRNDALDAIEDPEALDAKLDSMTEETVNVRGGTSQALEELPEKSREGKCYGILTQMAQGNLDIPVKLEEQAEHLANRVEEMGW
jgi:hypothetical protein